MDNLKTKEDFEEAYKTTKARYDSMTEWWKKGEQEIKDLQAMVIRMKVREDNLTKQIAQNQASFAQALTSKNEETNELVKEIGILRAKIKDLEK